MKQRSLKALIIELKENAIMLFIVIFAMTFIISQNKIPTGSMIPTLNIGDRLLVSMLPYYYRSPMRGECVVFNGPDGQKWIKRVIGLPGETIEIEEGNVYIDGIQLDETAYLVETGISELNPVITTEIIFPYTIPQGTYFLMGDNRLESYDCRYIGAIKEKEITGKAIYRLYPFSNLGGL